MKRVMLAFATLASLVTTLSVAVDAGAAIRSYTIENNLDDTCNIFVNGAFAGRIAPFETTPPRPVIYENVPGRTNVLLRCGDGGIYATSVEAIWDHCHFVVDEEGGGMRGFCQ